MHTSALVGVMFFFAHCTKDDLYTISPTTTTEKGNIEAHTYIYIYMAPSRRARPSTQACRWATTKKHGKRCQWTKGTSKKTCNTNVLSVFQCEKHRLAWSIRGLLRNRTSQGFDQILKELSDAKERAETLFRGFGSGAGGVTIPGYRLATVRCKKATQTVQRRRQSTMRYHPSQPSMRNSGKFKLLDSLDFQGQFDCLCSKIIWYLEDMPPHTIGGYMATLQDAITEVESFL